VASDKSSIILNAQRLTAKGEIDKAIEAWRTLIAETPNDGNIFNTVGDLYLKKNAKAQAIEAFLKAGTTFQDAGFALKTIAVYKKIIKLDPARMDVVLKLADVNAERGIVGNAVEDYLKVARPELKEGRVKSAIDVYRKIAVGPRQPDHRVEAGRVVPKEGMLDAAREELTRVATFLESAGRTDGLAHVRAKLAELGPGRASAAVPVEPGFKVERASLAEASAEETTMMTDAEPPRGADVAATPDVAGPAPVQVPPTPELSRVKTAQEFDETTNERLRDALTEADVYVKYGMVDKAIAHVKGLAQRDPNDVAIQLKLKELFIAQGDTRSAAEVCQRVSELYKMLGQEGESETMLREAVELGPDSSVVASVEEPPVAAGPSEELSDVAAPALSNPTAADDALEQDLAEADFYFQQGFDEEARRLFGAILKSVPGHALATQRLGELHARAASAQSANAAVHAAASEQAPEGTSRTLQPSDLEETSLGASLTLQEPPLVALRPRRAPRRWEKPRRQKNTSTWWKLAGRYERSLPPEEPGGTQPGVVGRARIGERVPKVPERRPGAVREGRLRDHYNSGWPTARWVC
jgi:tetratricopeptide (TPR) repeat protein